MSEEIPSSWVCASLGDVMDVQGGSQPPKSEFVYSPQDGYVRLLQIRDFGLKPVPTYVPDDRVTKFCETDDVLIARYGASLGRIVTGMKGAYNVALAKTIFDSRLLDKRYVFYILQTSILQTPLKMISRSAQNGFARHEIAHVQLPIPPLNEQRRIVAKIEELFSELDKGIESLKTAKAQLEVYRQAVLKHAFEGKLTEAWRKKNADKLETADQLLDRIQKERESRYAEQLTEWKAAIKDWEANGKPGKKPSKPRQHKDPTPITSEDVSSFGAIPQCWKWVKLGSLVWSVKDGPHYSPKYSDTGIPFLSGGNIRPHGIDFENVKFISPELHEELSVRCKPEVGDILYTKGGTTGIARVNTYEREFNVWVHVAVLKITQSLEPFYLQNALNGPDCYAQSQRYTHGVGNQDLGLTRMVNIILPLCSMEEMAEINRRIEVIESEYQRITDELAASLQQSESLRQSILKKAFSGQLVPQDPNDEPASVLLERIKAEKDAA
ncbi:restriction endonuclease subunit S [Ponticaulis profundi]|uniref:Restriction endonuclease subunit S n=1 Tax=Ponticaulis profundi TaxID=2665222 RepID=A0ABW1SDA4_9PROT